MKTKKTAQVCLICFFSVAATSQLYLAYQRAALLGAAALLYLQKQARKQQQLRALIEP
jgi:hypothetical protein